MCTCGFQSVYSLYCVVTALHGTSQRVVAMLDNPHAVLAVDRLEVPGRTWSSQRVGSIIENSFPCLFTCFALRCLCVVSADPAIRALYRAEAAQAKAAQAKAARYKASQAVSAETPQSRGNQTNSAASKADRYDSCLLQSRCSNAAGQVLLCL